MALHNLSRYRTVRRAFAHALGGPRGPIRAPLLPASAPRARAVRSRNDKLATLLCSGMVASAPRSATSAQCVRLKILVFACCCDCKRYLVKIGTLLRSRRSIFVLFPGVDSCILAPVARTRIATRQCGSAKSPDDSLQDLYVQLTAWITRSTSSRRASA